MGLKVLFLHPYGVLGDWNHRLKKQAELMSQKCNLKIINGYVSDSKGISSNLTDKLKKEIRDFNPDIIYVNGFRLAFECIRIFDKVVYDMGSWKTRSMLIKDFKITYDDMRKMSGEQIRALVNRGYSAVDFQKEDWVIKNASAIIVWESEEAKFIEKVHNVKVNQISMTFYDLPKPIPWKDKEDKVLAVAAKWGDSDKNHRLINHINSEIKDKKYFIHSVGHAGNDKKFINHKDLMDRMNKTKVVFCPYFCGGIGVVNEALMLGCNVIVGDWYPYLTYVNSNLIISNNEEFKRQAIDLLEKGMRKYYPPKKKFSTNNLDKIIDTCDNVIK